MNTPILEGIRKMARMISWPEMDAAQVEIKKTLTPTQAKAMIIKSKELDDAPYDASVGKKILNMLALGFPHNQQVMRRQGDLLSDNIGPPRLRTNLMRQALLDAHEEGARGYFYDRGIGETELMEAAKMLVSGEYLKRRK